MAENRKTYSPEEVFAGKQAAESVGKKALLVKGLLVASCSIILLMGMIFLISTLYNEDGSFTIRTGGQGKDGFLGALSLSETPGFGNPTVKLSGEPLSAMDNITYEWLPLDELDSVDGSHNGENYLANTFYVRNSSEEPIDFTASFRIDSATRGVDKAVRVMIYRDGVPTVYAQPTEYGTAEPVPAGVVNFESEDIVVTDVYTDVPAGQVTKYTVVIWLEGEDPECENRILKGILKFSASFEQTQN